MASCHAPPKNPLDSPAPQKAFFGLELVRRGQPLLGTFVFITAYVSSSSQANEAISAAFDEIRRIDGLMSLHRSDSELARLNARANHEAVVVSPELFKVIAAAQQIAEETEGAFDATVRPLTELWGFLWKEYRLPERAELEVVLPRVDYRLVELDAGPCTVRFRQPGVSLDLNAIAKGYAVDCAVQKLAERGVTNLMVRAGGDLRVMGSPPGASHWNVQLEDPEKKGRRTTISLRDAALSTSGNYENFFVVNGHRYSHILNPRTGLPVEGIAACTVIAPTCMESDAWSTACFVYGVEKSLAKFGQRLPIRFILTPSNDQSTWPEKKSSLFRAAERE